MSLTVVGLAYEQPFRYFDSSPEVLRLVVMMYVRYPLSAAQHRGWPCHANVARIRLSGKMAHDDLVCPPSVSPRDGVVTLAKNRPFSVEFAPTSRPLTA
jgi:hypothetical protein